MKIWTRMLLCAVAGGALGGGAAIWSVRVGALGTQSAIGPWVTGRDFGTAGASAHTRAVVALRGLLALPAHEARYYTAATDSSGQLLDGRCRYRVNGHALGTKWWSLTLYDAAGYLVPNGAGVYSVGSSGLTVAEQSAWTVIIAPSAQVGHWLPSGGVKRFELTLRAYLPDDGGRGDPSVAQLPQIQRLDC